MSPELIRFLRSKLDQDEYQVVELQYYAAPGQDVVLDSSVPMLAAVRTVIDLYAEVAHLDVPGAGTFAAGRAAGLGEAVRRLAVAYHNGHPAFSDM